jgi:hypothetical protein
MKNRLLVFVFLGLASAVAFAGGGRNRVVGSEATISALRSAIAIDGDLSERD